jgi:anti-sigma regulatory factor (Ser/Thr protein kinase)
VIPDARRDGPAALDRLEALVRAAGWAAPAALELRLVAEEVVTNVAKYGYEPGAVPALELRVSIGADAAVLEFHDQGRPFDPLAQPPPDLEAPLLDRPVGGLGLTLVRALVEEARYAREGRTNVLRLVKRRTEQ